MTPKPLKIATDLALPLAAVTEKLAWLGRTGSGKTYGAMKLAEQMLAAGATIGVIDPVGVWKGLRVPSVKGGRSFEVVVFGGLVGYDLPLEPTAGALIADLVVERSLSFVLDISQMIPSEQQRFVHDFAERFFQRRKSEPAAVHLFMEECQEYIPENPTGAEARTLGVMQRMWKLGRNFGIGGSLISQRPQEIAKKALNMSGTLFAFQMTGPQERKAIRSWVADQGVAVDIEAVLQRLKVGQAHVESPTFLEMSADVHIAARETADLSSTPKVVGGAVSVRPLTPIDVEQLKSAMAATIEKAKADDPKELRKQVAALQAEIARRPKASVESVEKDKPTKVVEKPVLTDAHLDRVERLVDRAEKALAKAQDALTKPLAEVRSAVGELVAAVKTVRQPVLPLPAMPKAAAEWGRKFEAAARTEPAVSAGQVTARGQVTRPQQRILNALAWAESFGLPTQTREKVAFLADASPRSSAYINNLGVLRSAGLIDYPRQGAVGLTAAGRALATTDESMPTTSSELLNAICAKLPAPQERIVRAVASVHPKSLTREGLAERSDASPTSSAFINNLGSLRSLGLIDYPAPGQVVALPVLFLEGR